MADLPGRPPAHDGAWCPVCNLPQRHMRDFVAECDNGHRWDRRRPAEAREQTCRRCEGSGWERGGNDIDGRAWGPCANGCPDTAEPADDNWRGQHDRPRTVPAAPDHEHEHEQGRHQPAHTGGTMSGIKHPVPEGTLVRVTSCTEGFDARVGTEFETEDYVNAEEAEGGVAFYWGSNNGGFNNVTAAASGLEVVKTAEAMKARTIPTCEQVARGLNLLGDHDVFDADETEPEGVHVLLYGSTPDGLRVAVDVKVCGVTRVDS